MTLAEAVVARLYELCDERGVTINKICVISGVTQSTVSDIVNRSTRDPRVGTIKKLCDGMEINIRQFFDSELFDNLEQELK